MRIFYSPNSGDPMLLDNERGLHWLAGELRAMASVESERTFAAEVGGSSAPYDELLRGLRIRRLSVGPTTCHIAEDNLLVLQISDADLGQLCRNLERLRNGDHTHLHSGHISLIFEADDVQC